MQINFSSRLRLTLAAVVLAAAPQALAVSFSNLFVFGDSLSDVGNVSILSGGAVPGPDYAPGRFTSNFTDGTDGRVWAEYVGDYLGYNLSASLAGGTNYAFGGAQNGPFDSIPPSLINQSVQYLTSTGGDADPDALYMLWGGGNDVLGEDVAGSAAELASIISDLADAGAQNFFVNNLPDIGATPSADETGTQAELSALTQQYNSELAAELANLEATLGVNIITLDVAGIFDSIIAAPGDFGLTNVEDACYVSSSEICADPDTYLFWDGVHPTANVHAMLSAYAIDAIEAATIPVPAALPLLLSALGLFGFMRKRRV